MVDYTCLKSFHPSLYSNFLLTENFIPEEISIKNQKEKRQKQQNQTKKHKIYQVQEANN